MDELSCPRCRMTKYRNPSLKLMINSCGHALCEACVELLFARESAPCPDCGRTIKRSAFRTQLFEDTRVDKEVDIRKMVLKIYNKLEDDFASLTDYNNYLEEIEDIIFRLESGENAKEVREKLAIYKQKNETAIRKNQIRINQERTYFKDTLAREEKEQQIKAQLLKQMDREADMAKKRVQEKLLEELKNNSGLSTAEVMERHKKLKEEDEKLRNVSSLEERMSIGGHTDLSNDMTSSTSLATQDHVFEYTPIEMDITGPPVPEKEAMIEAGYIRNVREATLKDLGGGYNSLMSCKRALYDAFGGLFVQPNSKASKVI